MKTVQKGFTLLELLIVIGIIGVISSVALATLGSARSRGDDSAVRGNLTSLRSQAEVYYLENKRYGSNTSLITNCTTATTFIAATTGEGAAEKITTDLLKNAGGSTNVRCAVAANGTAWAVSALLNEGGTICVHSATQALITRRTGTIANSILTTPVVTCAL